MTASPASAAVPRSPFVENGADTVIRVRGARDRVFAGQIAFNEPAWDILLSLKAAEGSASKPMTTHVGQGTGCAQTTAQRWLVDLERRGLVRREVNHLDRRKVCVSLTEQGSRLMDEALAAMARAARAR